ncbi:MAG TPA: hypothetical protein VFB24_12085 [Candidatus Binatia bacterium]|nr:hypothetical protein [Candidatus Binatia bacterium]
MGSQRGGVPVLTAAGIAAAGAGNWTSAEKHHRASIARIEAVPYVTAQPIARYWYADMLAQRGGPEDIEAAKALLQASITASDAIGLVLYARLARRGLAQFGGFRHGADSSGISEKASACYARHWFETKTDSVGLQEKVAAPLRSIIQPWR